MRFIAVLAIALLGTAAQATEVYKWKDKDGRVHYGDKPKHEAQALDVGPAEPAGPLTSEEEATMIARKAECDRLTKQYDVYSKAPSINETDGQGKTREYTPEERSKFLEQAQKKMQDACGPAQPVN